MKFFRVNFLVLTSTLIATSASANFCIDGMKGLPVNGDYRTTIKPDGEMQQLIESPDGSLQVYHLVDEGTEDDYDYKEVKIIVRKKTGEAIYESEDKAWMGKQQFTMQVDRAVFSPDGEKVLLAIDNPSERRTNRHMNHFVFVDTKTGEKTPVFSVISLGAKDEPSSYSRQEAYPMVFSADSKTLYVGAEHRIEVIDVATGNKIAELDRKTFGYDSQIKRDVYHSASEEKAILRKEQIESYAFSPDRSRIFVTFAKDPPVYHDLTTGKNIQIKVSEGNSLSHVSFEDNDNAIGVVSGGDQDQMSVIRWNAQSGKSTELYTSETSIENLVSRNGISVAQVVSYKANDKFSEKFLVFSKGSTNFTELNRKDAGVLSKLREGSTVDDLFVGNTGKYAFVALRYWSDTAFVFNTETGALIGTLDGKSFRFSESGTSVFYRKHNAKNYLRVDL